MFGKKQNQPVQPEAKPEPLQPYRRQPFPDTPWWTTSVQTFPQKQALRHAHFNPLLLVGLGADGAYILNQIAQGLTDLYPDAEWTKAIHLTAVGVEVVSALPKKLDSRIKVIDLEPNFEIFSVKSGGGKDKNLYHSPYLDWWYNAGEPRSERGGARMAIFTHLRNGYTNTALYRSIVIDPRDAGITRTYIVTSLSDMVGTALMWDMVHMLSRNADSSTKPNFTVMWLATGGSDIEHENEHAAAWQELLRLSVPRSVISHFNDNDVVHNRSLTVSGPARTILCGNPTDQLDRIENSSNSLALTADCILSTFDPAFNLHFDEWLNQPVPASKEFVPLLNTIGTVVYWLPTNRLREICEWQLVNNILFGRIGTIDGLFPNRPDEVTQFARPEIPVNFDAKGWSLRFLRSIKWNQRFFERAANIAESIPFPVTLLPMASPDDIATAYRDALLTRLDQMLNGDQLERDQIRKAMSAKLFSTQVALKELTKIWTEISKPIYLGRLGYDLATAREIVERCLAISMEAFDELGRWVEAILGVNSMGEMSSTAVTGHRAMRKLFQDRFNEAHDKLQKEYVQRPPHRIMLGVDAKLTGEPRKLAEASRKHADRLYQEWVSLMLQRETLAGSDFLSTIYSRIGWWVGLQPNDTDIKIKLCIVLPNKDRPTEEVIHSFDSTQLLKALSALKNLVNPFGVEIFKDVKIKDYLLVQDNRSLADQIESVGMPIMLRGDSPNASYVIAQSADLSEKQADKLKMVGWKIQPLSSEATPADRLSFVMLKSQIAARQLFAHTAYPKKISAYVFAAEQRTAQIEQTIQGKDFKSIYHMPTQFVYLLSDPELATLFGKCLLYGLLMIESDGQGIWTCNDNLPTMGGEGNGLLYYHSSPILKVMEDFVIRQPGRADQRDLFHPMNRKNLVEVLNTRLTLSRGQISKADLLATYDRLKMAYVDDGGHLGAALAGFFSWLEVILQDEEGRL